MTILGQNIIKNENVSSNLFGKMTILGQNIIKNENVPNSSISFNFTFFLTAEIPSIFLLPFSLVLSQPFRDSKI